MAPLTRAQAQVSKEGRAPGDPLTHLVNLHCQPGIMPKRKRQGQGEGGGGIKCRLSLLSLTLPLPLPLSQNSPDQSNREKNNKYTKNTISNANTNHSMASVIIRESI